MATKVIEFDLSTKGINAAIKEVEAHQKWIEERKSLLIERLAMLGVQVARMGFSNAFYAGKNDVSMDVTITSKEAVITASGEAVAFIEFGSGVAYGEGYPGVKPAGISAIGTYGKGKGSNPEGWVYVGEQGVSGQPLGGDKFKTKGNPPAMAMYNATREMEKQFMQIVREVFR